MAYANLKRKGKQNMGGLLTKAYGIPKSHLDLDNLPDLTAIGKLTVSAVIAVLATKGFIELYSTKGKNKIDDTTVGEIDGKSKENLYEFFYPGNEVECDEFEALAMNDEWIFIVPDTRGRFRIIGLCRLDPDAIGLSADLPAYLVSSNGTSGAAHPDLAGKTFQFMASAPHAPLYYTGAITLLPAV